MYFALFARDRRGRLVADILQFDPAKQTLTQFNSACGIQSIPGIQNVRMEDGRVIADSDGTPTCIGTEHSALCPALGLTLVTQFDRLCQGLRGNSPRTLSWLQQKGVTFT